MADHPTIFAAAFDPTDPASAVFAADFGKVFVYRGIFTGEMTLVPGADPAHEQHRVDLEKHDTGVEVNWVDWSPDGVWIASAGRLEICYWHAADGRMRYGWSGGIGMPSWVDVGFGPRDWDSTHVELIIGDPQRSQVHARRGMGLVYTTVPEAVRARYCPVVDDLRVLVAAGNGAEIRRADFAADRLGRVLHGMRHAAAVNAANWSPDGRRVVTASDDGTARVWDAATGDPVGQALQGDGMTEVTYAEFSPADADLVLTASRDGAVRLWRVPTGALVHSWPDVDPPIHWEGDPAEEHWVTCARFSGDGAKVVATYESGWIAVHLVPALG